MNPERWQKIEQLYHAALERGEAERVAYLEEACAGDDALRHEVESLLAQENRGDRFLESAAIEVAAKAVARESGQLLKGQQLGFYKVVSLLGVGGMGEVYQAQDTKLRREVAIKVLPTAFIDDPERLARFQREARMLASLNHPNIATIYGLEQCDGVNYLVMELVPGQTLTERITKGALPLEEALKVAGQIAEALEAAHEKGVIHRDLKPANVKVTPEGRVKVLDFGLAKAFANDGGLDLSNAPTLTGMASEEGRILGTPAYMSPEQARGKSVDKRTDIWAFGCILYELLSGKNAFRGDTSSDTIAVILGREPDWQALPSFTPANIRDLLRRTLQKDPQRRLRDIGDARIEIEEALAAATTAAPSVPSVMTPPGWRRLMPWVVAFFVTSVIIVGAGVWSLKPQPAQVPRPLARMAIALPLGEAMRGLDSTTPLIAMSSDGTSLVYVVRRGGTRQLYLRLLDQFEFTAIPGTEGADNPFFSPDGQWIGYFSSTERKLMRVSISGGKPLVVCDTSSFSGASWGPNDVIVFSADSRLYQVSAKGGQSQVVTTLDSDKGETDHNWPEFLPDARGILFSIKHGGEGPDDAQIVVQSLETGNRRVLIQGGNYPRYVRSGHLVYARGGTLMAVPFDLARLETTGTPVPVNEGILNSVTGASQFSVSEFGWLVYISGGNDGSEPSKLVWVDRKGAAEPLPAPPRLYMWPRLSPDGTRIAVKIVAARSDIWVYDLMRNTLTRLTSQADHDWPIWTPDGKRVTFTSNAGGQPNLFWKLADGSGLEERLTTSDHSQSPRSWSPDGQLLMFDEQGGPTTGIWAFPLQGDRKPRPVLQTPFYESHERLSPDGHWLAYMSDESRRSEIYVQPYPGPGRKWQISTEGGTEPVWARNGRELFYRSGDKMMAVDITSRPSFAAGNPRVLFEAGYVRVSDTPNYDVSPDGQHFLMVQISEQQSAKQLNVVLNWFEELKRRVPTGKK